MHDATRAPQSKSTRSLIVDRIRLLKSSPDLSPSHRLLLRSLVDYFGQRDECWPSVATLATECGLSSRHCRRLLRDLERSGWIQHRPRFRPDGSQTSSFIVWVNSPRTPMSAPPDTDVRPIETFRENPLKEHNAECGLSAFPEAISQPLPDPEPPETTPEPLPDPEPPETTPEPLPDPEPPETTPEPLPDPVATEAPTAPPSSPRWIQIENSTFSDPVQAARVYCLAVAGGLITPSDSDRLAFFAAWCAVSRKARAGKASNPGGMMRFLLSNPKALRAYPTAPDETRAREAIRRLYQSSPPAASAVAAYNPFRPVD
jgi:hypothetical protein